MYASNETISLRRRWRTVAIALAVGIFGLFLPTTPAFATVGPAQLLSTNLSPSTGWAGGGSVSFCISSGGILTSSYQAQTAGTCATSGSSSPGDRTPAAVCIHITAGGAPNGYIYFSGWDVYPLNHFSMASATAAYWFAATTSGECSAGSDPGAPALDATQGTSVCSRTLTDTSQMTGEFFASRTGMAHATVTAWSWAWGDGTTAGTSQNMNHTYGALSTMPQNGWTATVTMTITASTSHYFSDGTSVKTGTCSLRVDFLHPDQITSGSTGGGSGSTGDATLDTCLPSGWNWVNPLAIIGGMGCILKVLFIPSSSTVSSLGHLWDTATTKVPFSIINDAVTYIPATLDDMRDGVAAHSPILGYNYNVAHDVARSPICDNGAGGIHICGTSGYPFAGTYFDIHGFSGCSGDACESGNSIPLAVRTVLLFVITGLFLYACWRGAGEILK